VTRRLYDNVIELDGRPAARPFPRLAPSLHDRVAEALERSVEEALQRCEDLRRPNRILIGSRGREIRNHLPDEPEQRRRDEELAAGDPLRQLPSLTRTSWWAVLGTNRGPHPDALWKFRCPDDRPRVKRHFARRDFPQIWGESPGIGRKFSSETRAGGVAVLVP